jgi:hypothetical protein
MIVHTVEYPCHGLLNYKEDQDGCNIVLNRHCDLISIDLEVRRGCAYRCHVGFERKGKPKIF